LDRAPHGGGDRTRRLHPPAERHHVAPGFAGDAGQHPLPGARAGRRRRCGDVARPGAGDGGRHPRRDARRGAELRASFDFGAAGGGERRIDRMARQKLKRDNAGVIAPPPLLALAAVVFGLLLDGLFPAFVLTVLLDFNERLAIGIVLMAAGLALAIPAMRAFRRSDTHIEPWKPATVLVTDGIFRFLRNPMYVGMV